MSSSCAAIILAAGFGSRMRQTHSSDKSPSFKKEFLSIDSKPILFRSVESFIKTNLFDTIVLTLRPEDEEEARRILSPLNISLIIAYGGESRQESVLNSLIKIKENQKNKNEPEWVFIHDGARPFIEPTDIKKIYDALPLYNAVIPVTESIDAMKMINSKGIITEHLIRKKTVSAQTPQAFQFKLILDAHKKAQISGDIFIDDSEIWNKYIGDVYTVKGSESNRKITFPHDLTKSTENKRD